MVRGITGAVHRYLMADSWRRAKETSTEIGACLEPATGGADPCGAYVILKPWGRHAYARVPNPYRTEMEKVRGYFQTLYQREDTHPPGLPLVTHVDLDEVNDEILS